MRFDLAIINGTLVTASDTFQADVGIQAGKIAVIGNGLTGKEVVDASDCVVAPGFIDTEMTEELPPEVKDGILARIPQGRMGTADEVADVVSFLATRGHYVNGSVLHVNGGMYGG